LVTIDGPAGVEKSSISRSLAKRVNADFLDTGAMYRAAAAIALERNVAVDDEEAIVALIENADMTFDFQTDPPALLAWGASVMDRLRDADVSRVVSPVSALPRVREVLVRLQRRIGVERARLVSEGRDQGSVVFPQANVKIYLDASATARANRRAEQLRAAGEVVETSAIERAIGERDARDMSRAVGPLIRPADAMYIDSTAMTFDEVVEALFEIVLENAQETGNTA